MPATPLILALSAAADDEAASPPPGPGTTEPKAIISQKRPVIRPCKHVHSVGSFAHGRPTLVVWTCTCGHRWFEVEQLGPVEIAWRRGPKISD